MPPELKARVQAAAKANNRSMNAEIVALLEEKFPPPRQESVVDLVERLIEAMATDERAPPEIKTMIDSIRAGFYRSEGQARAVYASDFAQKFLRVARESGFKGLSDPPLPHD